MNYPTMHLDIVKALSDGALIHREHQLYKDTKNDEEFYSEFFKKSFGLDLKSSNEVYYISNVNTKNTFSGDFLLLLSALIYGMEDKDKNAFDMIYTHRFSSVEANGYIHASKHFEPYVSEIKIGEGAFSLKKLMNKGIVIQAGEEHFQFTPAIDLFLAYYEEIIKWGSEI